MENIKSSNGRTTVEQTPFLIPDLTIKDLLSAIPYAFSTYLPFPSPYHCPQLALLQAICPPVYGLCVSSYPYTPKMLVY